MQPTTPARPAPQVKVALFPEGAVAMNLDTGAYFQLNPVARDICLQLQARQAPAEIARHLAERFSLSLPQATADVAAVVRQLEHAPLPGGHNPLSFVAEHDQLLLCWEHRPVLALDAGSVQVRAVQSASVEELGAYLLWAVPHLLALQGYLVLHASAVQLRAGVLACCGPSGMGKTTLAARLAAAGAVPFAEDLVPLRRRADGAWVAASAEPRLRAWAVTQAAVLATGGVSDGTELTTLLGEQGLPLTELWFIGRHTDDRAVIDQVRLSGPAGMACLLHNSFAELQRPAVWELIFDGSAALARATALFQTRLPEGLPALERAVADYSRMMHGNDPPSV